MGRFLCVSILVLFAFATVSNADAEKWSSGPIVQAGFYASALAYDARRGHFFVGSYKNGEVLVLDRNGVFLQRLRQDATVRHLKRLHFDARDQSLWLLSDNGLAQYAVESLPAVSLIQRWRFESRTLVDIAPGEGRSLYLLDAAKRELLALDRNSGSLRVVSRFEAAIKTNSSCATSGALLANPKQGWALVSLDDKTWRVDLRSGEPRALSLGVNAVSSFIDLDNTQILAMQGELNRAVLLQVDAEGKISAPRALDVRATEATHFRGKLYLLDGAMRHHPDYCGDGRPNVNTRLRVVALQKPTIEVASRENR